MDCCGLLILIKSTVLNHTSTAQEAVTSCPPLMIMTMGFIESSQFDDNGTDMIRANAVKTEVAAYLADIDHHRHHHHPHREFVVHLLQIRIWVQYKCR